MNNNMNHKNNNSGESYKDEQGSLGGDNSARHDWKDGVRETIVEAATEAVDDVRDLAAEAKEEFSDIATSAKATFDAIPRVKKMEINHFASMAIVLVIGLIAGLAIGWNRGHMKGLAMQNHNGMSAVEMMTAMSANLDGLSGSELEQQFISDMIAHHQGAVTMATKLIGGANVNNEQLRAMAANIISTQSAEIEQMKAWQR